MADFRCGMASFREYMGGVVQVWLGSFRFVSCVRVFVSVPVLFVRLSVEDVCVFVSFHQARVR